MTKQIINNYYSNCPVEVIVRLKRQELLLGRIMTTVNELAVKLEATNVQLTKAAQEIQAQVAVLQEALVNQPLTQEAENALVALQATAQALDDLNPDVVV